VLYLASALPFELGLFALVIFEKGLTLYAQTGLHCNPICASQVAVMTGEIHHTQVFAEIGSWELLAWVA
jgi:hypothetical protein